MQNIPASPEPLLLLPGMLCDARLWGPQLAALRPERPVLVPDLTPHDRISTMAAAVLAEAPARFALAGLSLGGYVALEIMRLAPERVTRLAVLNSSARADTGEQRARRALLIRLVTGGEFRGVTPRLLPQLIHPSRLQDQTLSQLIMLMAREAGRDSFIRQQTAIMHRADRRALLPQIHVPTLVVGGDSDVTTPPALAEEMARQIPAATCHLLPRTGHLSPLEQPETVTRLFRSWLQR